MIKKNSDKNNNKGDDIRLIIWAVIAPIVFETVLGLFFNDLDSPKEIIFFILEWLLPATLFMLNILLCFKNYKKFNIASFILYPVSIILLIASSQFVSSFIISVFLKLFWFSQIIYVIVVFILNILGVTNAKRRKNF